jgi:hypothetical protein
VILMRYAHQPLSEIKRLPVAELFSWAEAVLDLVALENERGQMPPP